MKFALPIFSFLLLANISFAQNSKIYDDWSEAKEQASQEDKNILIILTGSEWCEPCKKMDINVLENPEFQEFAKQHLILFMIDIPGVTIDLKGKEFQAYTELKNTYKTNALPSLILTKNDGTKIKTLNGKLFNLKNVMNQLNAN